METPVIMEKPATVIDSDVQIVNTLGSMVTTLLETHAKGTVEAAKIQMEAAKIQAEGMKTVAEQRRGMVKDVLRTVLPLMWLALAGLLGIIVYSLHLGKEAWVSDFVKILVGGVIGFLAARQMRKPHP
jgi:hypothetical protein